MSSGRCFNRLLWIPSGPGARGLGLQDGTSEIPQPEGFVVDFGIVRSEVD